jgi:serine/threonine protein kinase
VVKFSLNQKVLENEICTLREMKGTNCPLLVGHGTLNEVGYYIMIRYHQNLEEYLKAPNLSVKFVFELGIQLLHSLQCVHSSGGVYNDL